MSGSPGPEPSRPGRLAGEPDGELQRGLAVAQALLDEGRDGEALEHLRELTRRFPLHAPAHNKLGICLARLGRLEEAAEAFERAAAMDPAYPAPWSNLGNVRLQQGELERAESAYRRALAIDPHYAPAHNNLAVALRRMGRYEEAVRHLKESVRLEQQRLGPGALPAAGRWAFYAVLGLAALLLWLWQRKGALLALLAAGTVWASVSAGDLRAAPARPSADVVVLEAGSLRLAVKPDELGFRFEPPEPHRSGVDGGRVGEGPGTVPRLVGPDPGALERLAARLDRAVAERPAEPRVFVEDGGRVTVVPGRPGRRVDRAALESALRAAVGSAESRVVRVPMEPVPPSLTEADLAPLVRAPALLASFTTRYDPAEDGRASNIATAARELDGVVLPPGGVFSFNEAVGPRVSERGYREAPVLVEGQFVEGVGGGVCQLSTTFYNAALLAGLKVLSRAPHSRPVWYVALARDAAVADGLIDLKLRNPYPYPLAVSARASEGELAVRLWGPRPVPALPWRLHTVVEMAVPGGEEVVVDPTLADGERVVDEPARTGYLATLWRELPLYGPAVARERVNRSAYPPAPARVRAGTGQEKAAEG